MERTAADNNPTVEGEEAKGDDISFTDVCRLGRVRIGGRIEFVVDSKERKISGQLFCKRFGDSDPPLKLNLLSLDEDVERDQRFKFPRPSILGRRCKFAEFATGGSATRDDGTGWS